MSDKRIPDLTNYTTPLDADTTIVYDNANTTTKKTTWANIKATLKTYLDTLYSPIFTTSAGLAAILSDETGSSGGFVRAGSPTITTPIIGDFTNAAHNHTNAAGGAQLTDAALSAAVGIAKGGTGQTTKAAGFDALQPMTTGGDLIYGGASGTGTRLANGTAGNSLVSAGTTQPPVWSDRARIADYQAFTGNGTWTKPTVATNSLVYVEVWGGGGSGGGGGGGAYSGGGGGGSYSAGYFLASRLGATETVTVGAQVSGGGSGSVGTVGNNSTFGSWITAYGGGPGGASNNAGAGGAGMFAVGGANSTTTGGTGGAPLGGAASTDCAGFGGGGGGSVNTAGGRSVYGGGGGGSGAGGNGGNTIYGGGGGSGGNNGALTGGTSVYGGAGGSYSGSGAGAAGSTPAGGGSGSYNGFSGGVGARGEIRVWTIY